MKKFFFTEHEIKINFYEEHKETQYSIFSTLRANDKLIYV